MSNIKGKHIFRYRLSPETFGYTLVTRLAVPIVKTVKWETESLNMRLLWRKREMYTEF
jgi:hypothetical protein